MERSPHLAGEEFGLLPGGEVATLGDLVVVREAGVDGLDPAAGSSPEFAGERREADRNRDRRRCLARCRGEGPSELPIPAGGRGAGAGQPVERDVVEDRVPGEIADGLAVDEGAGDLVVA